MRIWKVLFFLEIYEVGLFVFGYYLNKRNVNRIYFFKLMSLVSKGGCFFLVFF